MNTWGSRNAEDLYRIAVILARFDARELILEIHRMQHGRDAIVNSATVEHALANIERKYK